MKSVLWKRLASFCSAVLALSASLVVLGQGTGTTVGTSPTNQGNQQSTYTYQDKTPDKARIQAQVSGLATVLLDCSPDDAWPLTGNADGSVTVAYFGFDPDFSMGWNYAGLWKAGALSVYDWPQFKFTGNNSAQSVWITGFNGNGSVVAAASSSLTVNTSQFTYDSYSENFIAYWTPGSNTPATINGPLLKSYNLDDSRDNNYDYSATLLSFDGSLVATIPIATILDRQGNFESTITQVIYPGISGAPTPIVSYINGALQTSSYTSLTAVFSSNSAGKYLGLAQPSNGPSYYFAGDINISSKVTYLPLSINDAGSILGDDVTNGVVNAPIYKGDRVAAWILQEATGQAVTKPFVAVAGGAHQPLLGIDKATAVHVTGFDEAGNVYGSITTKSSTGGANVTQVIWVAKPSDWGQPAGTLAFTPIPWAAVTLPGNLTTSDGFRPVHPNAGLELGIATGTIIQPSSTPGGAPTSVTGDFPFTQVPAELRVDFNRDGKIDTSDAVGAPDREFVDKGLPYYFWINDDHDSGDVNVNDDDIPGRTAGNGANFAAQTVCGIRDLVDYFPVYLDIGQLLKLLPPGQNPTSPSQSLTYKLVQADGALNFVYTDLKPGNVGDYLRKTNADPKYKLMDNATNLGSAPKTQITVDGVALDQTWLGKIKTDGTGEGVILIDARQATQNPLQLVVDDQNGNRIVTLELPLSIDSVEKMFRRKSDRNHLPMIPSKEAVLPDQLGEPSNYADILTNGTYLVAVHGYNVNANEARGFAAEMFKRFWWSGSRARFLAFSWYGSESQTTFAGFLSPTTPDYPINVVNALLTGSYLNTLLTNLPKDATGQPPRIVLVAHSLGNMVCARALTQPGTPVPNVSNYFMIDAAIPAEAISDAERSSASLSLMPNSNWVGYPPRLWASNWYQVFSQGGVADSRAQLTWQDLFANLPSLTTVTNFYSDSDQVLENPPTQATPLRETVLQGGTLAWVTQEKLKGTALLAVASWLSAKHLIRDVHGGWGFNTSDWHKWVRTPGGIKTNSGSSEVTLAPNDVTDQSVPTPALATRPFFGRFQKTDARYTDSNGGRYDGVALLTLPGDPLGITQGSYFLTEAKLLGEAIPAVSYAVGSNHIREFVFNATDENFDLNTSFSSTAGGGFKSGWPASRPSPNWLHSDLLDVAYTYNFPLFDTITKTGALK